MRTNSRIRRVEIVSQREDDPADSHAFLRLQRLQVQNRFVDGKESSVYRYDGVLRKWLDAVVLLLVGSLNGEDAVCLRSCIRPPVLLRGQSVRPFDDEEDHYTLWELPAGLLEAGDRGEQGIKKRAAIEAFEETGYTLDWKHFTSVGSAPFASPGVIPERLYFFTARVPDLSDRVAAVGDGSPAEDGGGIWWVALQDAVRMCDGGEIIDAKTELGIRRLIALLAHS